MPYEREKTSLPKGILWGIAGLVFIFVAGFIISFYILRETAKTAVASRTQGLSTGIADLENMNFVQAAQEFGSVSASSSDLVQETGVLGSLFGSNNPVAAFVDITKNLGTLSNDLRDVQGDAPGFFSGNPNGALVAHLDALRITLHGIDGDAQKLSGVASLSGASFPGGSDFVSLRTELQSAETFLDALVPWLQSSSPHHVLVFLQNPSELRASGGFLGSYADVTIASGTISNISVHDIADVDELFTPNIVPPKALQIEEKRWRPADANWFLDFPTSASQTISFFERSGLYDGVASGTATGTPITFDGAIAVSPKVISDLLSLTGPITVSSTHTTFTADNFLVQIQKIVQDGQAASNAGKKEVYPKQVLSDLFAGMSNGLASSSSSTGIQGFLTMGENWTANKDLMAYFKDSVLENFTESWGAAGDVYALPQNFEGDYLALADTNVKGQKSDLYVAETLNVESQINTDGTVDDQIVLSRANHGNTSPYWWYDATSQDLVEIFTPPGSIVTNESGGIQKNIAAPLDYAKEGYSTDPLIASIESTTQTMFSYPAIIAYQEFGRQVFSTWSVVKPGSSSTISLDYTHRLFLPPTDGTTYQFIFDKQAGTSRHYNIEIDAPIGFEFAENGLSSFTYQSDDAPGRLVFNLTLQKI